MAMRLPGKVRNSEDFWSLLVEKRSGMCDVPKDRFSINGFHHPAGKPGTIPQNQAYYLEDVELQEFDPSVFPISLKELERLDPAQRQLLQVAYECMEDAGVSSWKGSSVGCFVGTYGEDWLDINAKETQHRGGYRGTAWGDFVLGNRVSYEFDLKGPSMTVKTACSSSLVCLDMACEAIRNGECDGALVGGTSLMFSPTAWQTLHDQGLLSPTGECRTFDAAANGYARGEAINMIYVKRLSNALQDGDNIRAVIRGSAVNCDGRTQGLTMPSASAQAALIRHTYDLAGITELSETAFVECHGTGTPVGDPIETGAVASCFGDDGLIITGVKPNVGHAEGAAGITSVIKCVLALEHNQVPPNINFDKPNPKIPFEERKLHVPVETEAWPEGRAERVSVNSFGIGGVNAHALAASKNGLGEPQDNGIRAPSASAGPVLLPISAYSLASLDAQVKSLTDHVQDRKIDLRDLAYTLANRREHRPYRAYAVTDDASNIQCSITNVVQGQTVPTVAWVFTGQGAQWPEMGAELIELNDVFRATIRKLDAYLQSFPNPPGWSIEDELKHTEGASRVNNAEFGHTLTIAVQIGLVDVLRSWNLKPDFVLGHSSGEMGAAYASGAISAEGAIAVATFRGTSNVSSDRKGSMAAIGLGREEISTFLVPGVVIACDNSQCSVTIAGDTDGVLQVIEKLKVEKPGVFARLLRVEKAFHSHHMREYGENYEKKIKPLIHSVDPVIAMYSSVSGKRVSGDGALEAAYWRRNMESPVLFNSALREALRANESAVVLLEIGPHPALGGPIGQILRDLGRSSDVHIGTLQRGKGCTESLLHCAGKLFQQNVPIDYSFLCGPGKFVRDLPRYSWQQDTTHWFEPRVAREWRFREYPPHELLGSRVFETSNEPSWRKVLALEDSAWLEGHEINGQVVLPGAAYIAMVGEALRQLEEESTYSLRNVRIASARVLEAGKTVELVTSLKPIIVDASEDSPWYTFTISSYDGSRWVRNCSGEARASTDKSISWATAAAPILPFARRVDDKAWYGIMNRVGLNYTGYFRGLRSISASPTTNEATAEVAARETTEGYRYSLHPAVIDRCFQVFTVAAARGLGKNLSQLVVPTFIGSMVVAPCEQDLEVKTNLIGDVSRGTFTGDLTAFSAGRQVLHLGEFQTSALTNEDGLESEQPLVSQLQWLPHSDLADLSKFVHADPRKPIEWDQLEEMILLCAIDHLEQVKRSEETPEHLHKFWTWLDAQLQRYKSGKNLFVSKDARLEELTRAQRLARIDDIAAQVFDTRYRAFSTAIHRLFKAVDSIFSGATHPLHVLLEDNVLTEFYNAGDVLDYNAALQIIGNTTPRMRILEVGAGTGGTSAKILDALKSSYGERLYELYKYTDVSSGFMSAAKKRFADCQNIEYAVLDVSKDPLEQGFEPGSFDLIIGANVIHATPTLRVTLGHLSNLLSPGGRLFLFELCPEVMFINYVMGYLPGWWLGAEDNRADQPWISPERWTKELVAVGFEEPDAVVLDYEVPYHTAAGIFVSHKSKSTKPSQVTLLCSDAGETRVADLRLALQSLDISVGTCRLGEMLPDHDVISLLDLEKPLLHDITEQKLADLIGTLKSAKRNILWLTPASQVDCADPRAAMTLGFARTARNDLGIKLFTAEIDDTAFDCLGTSHNITRLLLRINTPEVNPQHTHPDFEFAISGGEILVPRLHWQTVSDAFTNTTATTGAGLTRKHLDVKTPGLLHTMCWKEAKVQPLKHGEISVQTKAAGLNFRDVMIAMGVLNHNPAELGFEGCGIVREVGPGVDQFAVGDQVLYIGSSCLSTNLTLPAALCAKFPKSMTFEQAAALPAVYATALMGLVDKGNLQRGQSVLIQSACGGVGLAAIQISQMIGAEIYCTVGNEAKVQHLVKNYGIDRSRIFHSRDASFVADIMNATDNRGVDLVLNSLSGDLLQASWKCVAEFGTMVEIGKRDFLRRGKLSMEQFEQNRTFIGLELRLLSKLQPGKTTDLLRRSVDLVVSNALCGPTIDSVFKAASITDAFRHMQAARHIGKIVISIPGNPQDLDSVITRPQAAFRADRSYLLAGGLGGLGRSIATWMVEHGARHLIFLARSARVSSDTRNFLDELKSCGCHVQLVAGTVSESKDVQRAVAGAAKPLAGVLNLAMVLKDVGLGDMTFTDWKTAVEPKVNGTWNLHHASLQSELDFFVLFSSYAGFGGHNGQANYAAGNTFLDAFVQYRHKKGLAASVIDVGVMADVGFVARDARLLERLEKTVMRPVREQELLDTLLLSMQRSKPSLQPARGRQTIYENPSQILLGLVTNTPISSPQNRAGWKHDARMGIYYNHDRSDDALIATTSDKISLKAQLMSETSEEAKAGIIAKAIASALANFLIKPEGSVPLDKPLAEIGLDSLVAIEVRNWIRQQVGLTLTTITIIQSPSLTHLAEEVRHAMDAQCGS
ncbi:putative polyketide synthase [Lepidopterella palustris CBS 459.81]|uniref:Putative polyketide synthase n=1 Tax=Lepidopterella palustris CBS 459.81 TaxID=1314670 RepID=A0A8E2E4Y1_9PEZI|nr:putative polyketide synthase [Lepidopterella palustris CBS 459.81]